MENAKISNLYDLDETIAKEYLEQFTYPWEALKGISEFIKAWTNIRSGKV